MNGVVTVKVTASGQMSLPAEVRRRWGVAKVAVIDEGPRVVLIPVPEDPIGAALGSLKGPGPSSEEMRRAARAEEEASEARRQGR